VSGRLLRLGAGEIAFRDTQPFAMPTFLVAGNHPACRLEDFADRPAALLRFAETAPELVGEPRVFRPMVPAIWLVMREPILRDPVDLIVLGFHYGHALHS
jgi:hypothetical protein